MKIIMITHNIMISNNNRWIGITFVGCIIASLCYSIRYSFRVAIISSPFSDDPFAGHLVRINDNDGAFNKIRSTVTTNRNATAAMAPAPEVSSSHISRYSQSPRSTSASTTGRAGQQLYTDSLRFLHRLVTELGGLTQWHKYLKLKKGKRFSTTFGQNFTQHIYHIATEEILRTAAAATTTTPLIDTNLAIPPEYTTITLNCSHPKYAQAFTGRLDEEVNNGNNVGGKVIIDWTMVGWDHDLTEIRLAEYGDLIDRLVLFDMDTTLKGVPKPIVMPGLLETRFQQLYRPKIDYHLVRNFASDIAFGVNGTTKNFGSRLQVRFRNYGRDYVRQVYNDTTTTSTSTSSTNHYQNRDRLFIIQNDGDEIMTRETVLHVKYCEWKEPEKVLYAPAVNYERNLAWIAKGTRMEINVHGEEQNSYSDLIPYNWLKGPAIEKLYRTKSDTNFRQPYFKAYQNYKVRHLGLGSAIHLSSPAYPISSILKSMSTNDDPHFLKEFDTEFLQKAGADGAAATTTNTGSNIAKLSYLELRKISFDCTAFSHILDALNESTYDYTVSTLPWIIAHQPERYPWLIYNKLHEKERQVKACICSKNWRTTIRTDPMCLELQQNPWR